MLKQLRNWLFSINNTFGTRFLLLVSTTYCVQGFKSFSSLAVNYLFKDILQLEPSEAQALTTTMYIPWGIKPVYGIVSDSLPFFGYHRKSYLLLFGIVGLLSFLALSMNALTNTAASATFFLLCTNLATAFNDVVIDAKVVEMARLDPKNGANDLQTLSWSMMSLGGILGSFLGGPMTDVGGPRMVFFIASIGPVAIILLSFSVRDKKVTRKNRASCCSTAKKQTALLARSLKTPIVWKSALWIFLSGATSPAFGQISFYYSTEVLMFTPEFLGTIGAFGYIFLMVGTVIYNTYFKSANFKTILFYAQLALAGISLLDILLVTRANLAIGIPDKVFVMGDEIISDVVGRMKTMPMLVLAAKICGEGVEGTLFALIMSISNFSYSVSSYWGAILCSMLDISRNQYENYWIAILIRSIFKLIPIFFLFLIPSEVADGGSKTDMKEAKQVELSASSMEDEVELETVSLMEETQQS